MFDSLTLMACLFVAQEQDEKSQDQALPVGSANVPELLTELGAFETYRYDLRARFASTLLGHQQPQEGENGDDKDTAGEPKHVQVMAKVEFQRGVPLHLKAGSVQAFASANALAYRGPDQDWTPAPRSLRADPNSGEATAPELLALAASPSPQDLLDRLPLRSLSWSCSSAKKEDPDPQADRCWVGSMLPAELTRWPAFRELEGRIDHVRCEIWVSSQGQLKSLVLTGWQPEPEATEGETEESEEQSEAPMKPAAFRLSYELRDFDGEIEIEVPEEAREVLDARG